MTFQVSDKKERHFLNLWNIDEGIMEPSYSKEGIWIKYISHSNLLYARATRVITNNAPIGEYWLGFFPREDFSCLYGNYLIESRFLHECKRYNKYWNLRRDTIGHFVAFLEFNENVFSFSGSIT